MYSKISFVFVCVVRLTSSKLAFFGKSDDSEFKWKISPRGDLILYLPSRVLAEDPDADLLIASISN